MFDLAKILKKKEELQFAIYGANVPQKPSFNAVCGLLVFSCTGCEGSCSGTCDDSCSTNCYGCGRNG